MNDIKVVILAGGYGTRIAEETSVRPKPMVEIGGKPILWHIMKIFSTQGFNDFIVCAGYKGETIKEYFDKGIDNENWNITVVDTGQETMTGGRIKRIKDYVGNDPFFLTYGDGIADIDLKKLLEFHNGHNLPATVTAVQPEGRFGILKIEGKNGFVSSFREKPKNGGAWINGGFFILDPKVIDYIKGDETVFEQEPMKQLVEDGQLAAYRHRGFWMSLDTLRDKNVLEDLWQKGRALWKIW